MKIINLILLGIFVLGFSLFLIRLILPSQLDDVNPLMNCTEEELESADEYYVVPKFSNISILEINGWCRNISSRDKKLFMHGVYHTYEEFGIYRDKEYFSEGVWIFEKCFGFRPNRFKPGQLAWIKDNSWIKDNIDVDLFWNQLFHKVYHCGDTGLFPNWMIKVF